LGPHFSRKNGSERRFLKNSENMSTEQLNELI